jgi:hypothetical protein
LKFQKNDLRKSESEALLKIKKIIFHFFYFLLIHKKKILNFQKNDLRKSESEALLKIKKIIFQKMIYENQKVKHF